MSLTGPQLYCSQTVPGSHDRRIKATVHEAASTLQRALRVTPTFQPYSHSDVFLPFSPTFKSIHPLRPYSGPLPPEAAQAQQSHDWTISPRGFPILIPSPHDLAKQSRPLLDTTVSGPGPRRPHCPSRLSPDQFTISHSHTHHISVCAALSSVPGLQQACLGNVCAFGGPGSKGMVPIQVPELNTRLLARELGSKDVLTSQG